MQTGDRPSVATPRCPRCGYDQTGLVESWTRSCPLAAICAECGYEYDPADARNPSRRRLPWLYEHAKHWWSVRTYLRTVLMLLWPPSFWKRVRPEHEVRIGRLIGMFLWPYPLLCAGYGLLHYADAVLSWRSVWLSNVRGPTATWSAALRRGTTDFCEFLVSGEFLTTFWWRLTELSSGLVPLLVFWLPVAASFVAIPSEWAGSRLTKKHMVRLLAYAALPMSLVPIGACVWELALGAYEIAYNLRPISQATSWPRPWHLDVPPAVFMAGMLWLTLLWPPLYWFFAIRRGFELRSTMRPFLVVMAVFLTPWALFLLHTVYWTIVE